MFKCPESTIRKVERLPVCCDDCGYCAELTGRSEDLDAALVVVGHFHDLRTESILLERLRTVLSSVPDWQGRFLSSGFVRRAPEFREAMAADPELSEFLRISTFQLVPRFQFIESAVSEIQSQLQPELLRCPSCDEGTIRIDPAFFERL